MDCEADIIDHFMRQKHPQTDFSLKEADKGFDELKLCLRKISSFYIAKEIQIVCVID